MLNLILILHTIAIIVLFVLVTGFNKRFSYNITKNNYFNKITSVAFYFRSYDKRFSVAYFNLRIRDARKLDLREDLMKLSNQNNPNIRSTLNAKFSWLENEAQVLQFQKDYSVIDKKFVDEMVSNFYKKEERKK